MGRRRGWANHHRRAFERERYPGNRWQALVEDPSSADSQERALPRAPDLGPAVRRARTRYGPQDYARQPSKRMESGGAARVADCFRRTVEPCSADSLRGPQVGRAEAEPGPWEGRSIPLETPVHGICQVPRVWRRDDERHLVAAGALGLDAIARGTKDGMRARIG